VSQPNHDAAYAAKQRVPARAKSLLTRPGSLKEAILLTEILNAPRHRCDLFRF
jgi:hypothetical protein